MTIENFLSFWTSYNTGIIEALIALVIILSLFLAYRSFLRKEEEQILAPSIDTKEIEKTLQRILENQGNRSAQGSTEEEDLSIEIDEELSASAAVPKDSAEAQKLRTALAEKQLKVQTLEELVENLKAQLANAGAAGTEASTAAAPEAPSAEDLAAKKALEDKVRDLEARLSEYEIISEDIADLTRYREENEKLKEQLANVGSTQDTTSAPSEKESEEVGSVAVESASEEAPASIDDMIDQALAENAEDISAEPTPVPDQVAADIAESSTQTPAEEDPSNLIDDELMREFAAAVEDQKSSALGKVAEKAGDGKTATKTESDESEELMNEFQNFVNKKS